MTRTLEAFVVVYRNAEEKFYGVVNKLGNKLLLEEKINRAIGNEWFRTKVSTKLENKTGYINTTGVDGKKKEDRLFGDNDMLSAVVAVLCKANN